MAEAKLAAEQSGFETTRQPAPELALQAEQVVLPNGDALLNNVDYDHPPR